MVVRQIRHEPDLIKAIFKSDLKAVSEILEDDQDSIDHRDSEKRTPLHAAAYMGDPEIVRLLIEYGARINVKDSQWMYPLHRACASINLPKAKDIVSILLDNEADVNARDKSQRTCLHIAAKHNSVDSIQLILNQNINSIDVSDRSGRTALHYACQEGHLEMVQLLIQNGAKVNMSDKKERRPIHVTAIQGNIEVLEILVSAGADINARDKDKMTALHFGCAAGHLDMVTTLLDRDAKSNLTNNFGNTCLHLAALNGHTNILTELCGEGLEVNDTNNSGQTSLHLSTRHNLDEHMESCLAILLVEGANLGLVDCTGRTALHLVARHGGYSSMSNLVKHCQNPSEQVLKVDKKGQTCLHIAAANSNNEIIDTLWDIYNKYGIDIKEEVNRPDFQGRSALHLAASSGSVSILRKLVDCGGKLELGDLAGRTPLHTAAYSGSIECVEYLLNCGANHNLQDNEGRLGTHYASTAASIACLQSLLYAGCNINAQDRSGMTALHLAGQHDNSGACLQLLLEHNADVYIHNDKGYNVLHHASLSGNWVAIQHIIKLCEPNGLIKSRETKKDCWTTAIHLAAQHGHSEALMLLAGLVESCDLQDSANRTPLYLAAAMGHLETCVILIDQGCQVRETCGDKGRNAVHVAAEKGHVEVLERFLLTEPSNIDVKDKDGMTCLMLASCEGQLEAVRLLLKSKANPRCIDTSGLTALTWAILSDQELVAELIIETSGKSMLTKDVMGRTACHLAAAKGQFKTLISIMELEPSAVKWTDSSGFTPLHYAASAGQNEALGCLLNFAEGGEIWSKHFSVLHCAALQDRDKCAKLILNAWGQKEVMNKTSKGWTPLHTAASNNAMKTALLLINQGANLSAVDNKKRTPLILASKHGHTELVKLLLDNHAEVADQDLMGNTGLHYACYTGDSKTATGILEHMEQKEQHDWVSLQNDIGKTPLHLAAGQGLVETTKLLLMADASLTITDSDGNPPALCCAKDDDTATCLAMILAACEAIPTHEYRQSLCSVNSSRRSEMVQRLSEYFSDLDITAPALSSPGAPAGVNHGGAATHNHRKSNGVGPGKRLSSKPGIGGGGGGQENGIQFQIDNIAENSSDVISTKKL